MWSIDRSIDIYGVENWSNGYFSVNQKGNLEVAPQKENAGRLDIMEIVNHVKRSNCAFPVLFRFPQIIEDRLKEINGAFQSAIEEYEYNGNYRLAFPLKVDQRKDVVEYIVEGGKSSKVGLEVGSKAELLAALSMDLDSEAVIICNGYKDEDYLKLALKFGQRQKIVVVVDIFEEIFNLICCSQELKIKPRLGLRAKLFSRGSGRWEESGGETSKFGLSAVEISKVMKYLSQNEMLDGLGMLHFHIGSQITDIRRFKDAVNEAARIYAKVRKDAQIEYFNVGGGLSVDYDGTKTPTPASTNYSLQEYANDVVYTLQKICDEEGVPCPTIVSESGRALAAYHSFLAFEVIGKKNSKDDQIPPITKGDPIQIQELREDLENINLENYAEHYHDALHYRDELLDSFNLGTIDLEERAKGEILFWNICQKVTLFAQEDENYSDEFENLKKLLSKKYIGNFSLFQSVPDIWGVQQLFPIMPLHRLNEEPSEKGTIADVTCDSDGEIRSFVGQNSDFLALHPLKEGENYYLGIFLLGAYQDTLGDFHNLLGCVNEAHILVDDESWQISRIIEGNKCQELLKFFNYDLSSLDESISNFHLSGAEEEDMKEDVKKALKEYTYFKDSYLQYI